MISPQVLCYTTFAGTMNTGGHVRIVDQGPHLHAEEEETRFMTFESRLEARPVANPQSIHHITEVSFCKYQELCIRGFLVQGILVLDDSAFAEARRIVDIVGWMYTVLHARSFCPRVIRECISNLYSADNGVYIRGCHFDFDLVVINQLFMTPFVEQSHTWEDDDLTQAIVFLTGGHCHRWETFSLTYLLPQYLCLYKLCEINWLPGFHADAMMKKHLHFLFAFIRNKPIDFGRLVYDQVVGGRFWLFQVMNPLIGYPLWISGVETDISI